MFRKVAPGTPRFCDSATYPHVRVRFAARSSGSTSSVVTQYPNMLELPRLTIRAVPGGLAPQGLDERKPHSLKWYIAGEPATVFA
jgi:hypothetical protein